MPCPQCGAEHENTEAYCPTTGRSLTEPGLIGTLIAGKYRAVKLLGVGGMGEVFDCEDVRVGRRVCLKRLLPQYRAQPAVMARFEREARVAASVEHANVIEIFDVGTADDGSAFFVMPRLVGESLAETIDRTGPLPIERACLIQSQILSALEAAHAKGVIHRDLKPDNVFLVEKQGDLVKLLDFGISRVEDGQQRLTTTGMLVGTPAYMSPEQARGERDLDHRTDLWAAGVILFEMLAGAPAFEGNNFHGLLVQISMRPPPRIDERRPDVPLELARLVDRSLAANIDDRYQTASELLAAVLPFASGHAPGASTRALHVVRSAGQGSRRPPDLAKQVLDGRTRPDERPEGYAQTTPAGRLDDGAGTLGTTPAGPSAKGERGRRVEPGSTLPGPGPRDARPSGAVTTPAKPVRKRDASLAGELTAPPEGDAADVGSDAPGTELAAPPGRRNVVLAGAGIAMLVAAGGVFWVALRPPHRPASTPAPSAVSAPPVAAAPIAPAVAAPATLPSPAAAITVELRLSATPPDAVLVVDGARVPNPFTARFAKDGVAHNVAADAPGYKPARQLVVADADRAVTLALEHAGKAPMRALPAAPLARGDSAPAHHDTAAPSAAAKPPASKPDADTYKGAKGKLITDYP